MVREWFAANSYTVRDITRNKKLRRFEIHVFPFGENCRSRLVLHGVDGFVCFWHAFNLLLYRDSQALTLPYLQVQSFQILTMKKNPSLFL